MSCIYQVQAELTFKSWCLRSTTAACYIWEHWYSCFYIPVDDLLYSFMLRLHGFLRLDNLIVIVGSGVRFLNIGLCESSSCTLSLQGSVFLRYFWELLGFLRCECSVLIRDIWLLNGLNIWQVLWSSVIICFEAQVERVPLNVPILAHGPRNILLGLSRLRVKSNRSLLFLIASEQAYKAHKLFFDLSKQAAIDSVFDLQDLDCNGWLKLGGASILFPRSNLL